MSPAAIFSWCFNGDVTDVTVLNAFTLLESANKKRKTNFFRINNVNYMFIYNESLVYPSWSIYVIACVFLD